MCAYVCLKKQTRVCLLCHAGDQTNPQDVNPQDVYYHVFGYQNPT